MKCQSSKVNCNSQVCWRQGNLQELWLPKEEEDDGFDGTLGYTTGKSRKCSHSDTSISRNSRLITIRQLSISGKVDNHLGLGKRHWNLETSSVVVAFLPPS